MVSGQGPVVGGQEGSTEYISVCTYTYGLFYHFGFWRSALAEGRRCFDESAWRSAAQRIGGQDLTQAGRKAGFVAACQLRPRGVRPIGEAERTRGVVSNRGKKGVESV